METAAQNAVLRLYHYQGANLDYLRDTLADQRVCFSNPKNFNDPWDCCPYFEPATDDAESRRKWGDRLSATYEGLPSQLRAQLEAKCQGNWYDNKELLRRSIDSLSDWVRQVTIERWRIYCLTPHPDSVLMWAHYAEKHKGICLEFDTQIEQVGRAYRVLYRDTLPLVGADDFDDQKALADVVLLTKSREWAYEDEYRMMARDGHVDPTFSLRTDSDYLHLPPGALTGIIAGCNADVKAVQALADEFGRGISIRRAVRVQDRYELRIVG